MNRRAFLQTGALAATLWVAFCLTLTAVLDDSVPFMTLTVSAAGPTSSEVTVSMKP